MMTTVWNNECNIVLCLLHNLKASTHEALAQRRAARERQNNACHLSEFEK
jgi:hypothetical protein